MPINADKPHLWKADVAKSVDLFNTWFMECAPAAYRTTRVKTTEAVKKAMDWTCALTKLDAATLAEYPSVLPMLRMCTAPPIARDRLIGLASVPKGLVTRIEDGKLPCRMCKDDVSLHLTAICLVLSRLLDEDLFPWIASRTQPPIKDLERAATIVADRLCGSVSDPIIRNAQEQRQLCLIEDFLEKRGYRKQAHPSGLKLADMEPGTFSFRMNILVGTQRKVRIPVDVVVQPMKPARHRLPVLIEAKSAGDFTNTNKRRKEEATKIHQLRAAYGQNIRLILFLCGYFDSGYLGYEAAEGLDWVWEHRISDLLKLGI